MNPLLLFAIFFDTRAIALLFNLIGRSLLLVGWQKKILVQGLAFLIYMALGAVAWLIAVGANLYAAVALFAAANYAGGAFALALAPLPGASALILGGVNGGWIVLIFNIPLIAFLISLPIATFVMDRLRVFKPQK